MHHRLLPRADNRGRVAALEMMVMTKTVQEHIRDASLTAGLKDVLEKGAQTYGMQSFDQHLSALYRQGLITLEVATQAASNPADFQRALNFVTLTGPQRESSAPWEADASAEARTK